MIKYVDLTTVKGHIANLISGFESLYGEIEPGLLTRSIFTSSLSSSSNSACSTSLNSTFSFLRVQFRV